MPRPENGILVARDANWLCFRKPVNGNLGLSRNFLDPNFPRGKLFRTRMRSRSKAFSLSVASPMSGWRADLRPYSLDYREIAGSYSPKYL